MDIFDYFPLFINFTLKLGLYYGNRKARTLSYTP